MKTFSLAIFLFCIAALSGFTGKSNAQNGPVMYFCEKYENGEIGIGDKFTEGKLTVIVRCDYAIGIKDATLLVHKYNNASYEFSYYKEFPFTVAPDLKTVIFQDDKLEFTESGIFMVYLVDSGRNSLASAIVYITTGK